MPPYASLKNPNAVKRLILDQARQIECLKRQLEEYKRDESTETNSTSSSSLVYNASSAPAPSTSINTGLASSPFVKLEPRIKSEERIELPSSASTTTTHQKRRLLPTIQKTIQKKVHRPSKRELQLSSLPTKKTFKKRIKNAIELDGYNREAHFQHLIYQDSKLPPSTKNDRWNFAFRFCSYFVLSGGRKIFVKTLIHGNRQDNKKTSITSFPGLHAFLRLKKIDAVLLEKTLAEKTVAHFTKAQHQVEIVQFLHAFCSFLYAFLPQEKRVYKARGNVNDFQLSAIANTTEEEDINEIKKEVDPDLELIESGLKDEHVD